jgi:hypothetical protein
LIGTSPILFTNRHIDIFTLEMTNMTHISNIHLDSANMWQKHRIYWLAHHRIYWLAHHQICWLIGTLTAFTLGEMTYTTHSSINHLDSVDIRQKHQICWLTHHRICWLTDTLTVFTLDEITNMTHNSNKHSNSASIWQKTSNLLTGTSLNLLTDWHIDRIYTRWNDKHDPHLKHPFRLCQYSTKITKFIDCYIAEFID